MKYVLKSSQKVPYYYIGMIAGMIIEGTQKLNQARVFDSIEAAEQEQSNHHIYIGDWIIQPVEEA